MNRRYIALMVLSFVLGSVVTLGATSRRPEPTYFTCLLDHVTGGMSDRAVQLVRDACRASYPENAPPY